MTIAREGLPYVAGAAGVAVLLFALALNRRSWPLWLLALALIVAALGVSYAFRGEVR
ncbi:MAG: hypothetical protein H0X64_11435 [Gemmatimonadaceae bacterium]|nr:hypothetical protein [Gemmatimonadaceae bacterium]